MISRNSHAKKPTSFFVYDNILGDSPESKTLRRRIVQLAKHRYNAVIQGPPGSGKRLVGRALHEHGPRRDAAFIPVDCSYLSGRLFYSQLFGQVYQETTSLGCMRSADGGTLLLANVDRLDLDCQAALLDAIESSVVTPLGGDQHDRAEVDVRIVCTSERDLESMVRDGQFRADLLAALHVVALHTAPLSQRMEDLPAIAHHLLARTTFECGQSMRTLDDGAIQLLAACPWPGNVRELAAVLDKALESTDSATLSAADLPIKADDTTRWPSLAEIQRQHIQQTLRVTQGCRRRAAKLLGINEATIEQHLGQ